MIKLEHQVLPSTEQMEFVIEGMRNPMNSWSSSDSFTSEQGIKYIGVNDYNLMKRLSIAGTDHRKFMRMIPVCIRITAPLYWWKEFDTYKVGTVANSCSTMHKIADKEFDISDFSCEHLFDTVLLEDTIIELNKWREYYIKYDELDERFKSEHSKKDIWWQMIQLLPSSYNQTRNVTLNYEVLANIYRSRKNHKLDEWRDFCGWIMTLPYSNIIRGIRED